MGCESESKKERIKQNNKISIKTKTKIKPKQLENCQRVQKEEQLQTKESLLPTMGDNLYWWF